MVSPSSRALSAASISLFQAALLPLPNLHQQDSNLALCQQCPSQLCRSLLSLLISQGAWKYRQWPCPCHTTVTTGHTARVVFRRRLWSCAVLPDTSPPIRCQHHPWETQPIHAAALIPPAEQNPTAAREGEQFPGDLPSWRGATGTSTPQGCGAISPPVRLHQEDGNSALLSLQWDQALQCVHSAQGFKLWDAN